MENEKDQIGYEYKMGDYERIAQRFIIPMYLKDYDDSIQPSSSATMIKYFNSYFLIFAAHAVAYKEENLKK